MSNIQEVVKEAPYTRLVRILNTPNYYLFVAIKVPRGKTVNWSSTNNIQYLNGTTLVNLDIVQDIQEERERTVYRKFLLSPPHTYNLASDIDFEVTVHVLSSSKKNTILYRGVDVYENIPDREIDVNAPYLYLSNPEEDISFQDRTYAPRCLLFLQGQLKDQKLNYDSEGNLNAVIKIEENPTSKIAEVHPGLLSVNRIKYYDVDPITKEFTLTVNIKNKSKTVGTITPKKGRRKNKSSNTDNTSFIDLHLPHKEEEVIV